MPGAGARPRANWVGVAPCRADDGAGAVPSHFCVPGPAFSLWGGLETLFSSSPSLAQGLTPGGCPGQSLIT